MTNDPSVQVVVTPDHVTVAIAGDFDVAVGGEFEAAVRSAIRSGDRSPIEFDLNAVTFIDSHGLRAVFRCHRLVEQCGRVCELNVTEGPVSRLFRMTGVTDRFEYSRTDV